MAIFQFANRNKLQEGNPMVYHGFPYRRMVITYPIVPQMDHKWTTNGPPLYHHCTTIVPFLLYHINIHKPSSLGLFHFHFFSVASRSLRGSAASLPIAGLPGYATNNGYTMWGPQTIATLVYD